MLVEYKTLRLNDTGELVERLQQALSSKGYSVGRVDGIYGPMTEAAVRKFQKDNNLVADGIAGSRTLTVLYGKPADPRFLTQGDIEHAAKLLDIDVALMQALAEKESGRSGFFPSGKPAILFERHIMYRQLRQHGLNADEYMAKYPDLVNTATGGYKGGEAEHSRLEAAKLIHRESAIESASWGRFQILGVHYKNLGYLSADEWERRMSHSEGEQLIALVRFIKANKELHEAFRKADYVTIARLYNGPAYMRNNYHTDLEKLHAKHKALYDKAIA